MSAYLTEEEIDQYCTRIPDVTIGDVIIASGLIDAYCGSFEVQEHTQHIKLKRKRYCWGTQLLGRLKYTPVAEIISVKTVTQNMFGRVEEEVPADSIYLDEYGYFTYVGKTGNEKLFGIVPCELIVNYVSGYEEYPENLKIACAILAQNIVQYGGFLSWQSKKDIDYSITLADSNIFTKEIKIILDGLVQYV